MLYKYSTSTLLIIFSNALLAFIESTNRYIRIRLENCFKIVALRFITI